MLNTSYVHLPNGTTLTCKPVFGGISFSVNELNYHHTAFPPGWTVIIHSEYLDHSLSNDENLPESPDAPSDSPSLQSHKFKSPTLENDALFISSITNPSSQEFKPAVSPSRQIAMMLWATLYWYFHQPRPASQAEANEAEGDWRVRIKGDGIFKRRHLLSKLERMGLIATEDASVGVEFDDRLTHAYSHMFVSQQAFWQTDPRIFLFTLSATSHSPYGSNSPVGSRPNSPSRGGHSPRLGDLDISPTSGLWTPSAPGPFSSASHLPTFYPPPPLQYVTTKHMRHPLRPKPYTQGETFYCRYVPRFGQYLTFRVASLSPKPVAYNGPMGFVGPAFLPPGSAVAAAFSNVVGNPCDVDLLETWMAGETISAFAHSRGSPKYQGEYLRDCLRSNGSFPAIGCWDGKPFGFFSIYWAKEENLMKDLDFQDYDRGFHVLVGEPEFRAEERLNSWLSALVHYVWLSDSRTNNVYIEPSVNDEKFISALHENGFEKVEESSGRTESKGVLMKATRASWYGPVL